MLTSLCCPYLPLTAQYGETTTPLTAQESTTRIVPQSATSSAERPSPESTQEREEALDQTHHAPDPAVLQERRARLTAVEHCQRVMELLVTLDDTLATQEARSLADILPELREVVEQLPETPLP
jgi:hypothetical protein